MDAKETIERDFQKCWNEAWRDRAKEILKNENMKELKGLCEEIFSIASGEFLAFLGDEAIRRRTK